MTLSPTQFKAIANKVVPSELLSDTLSQYTSFARCNSQFVGVIEISKNGAQWIDEWILNRQNETYDALIKKQNKEIWKLKILNITLESSHKCEYNKGKAIGPAMGLTGRNIKKWFPTRLITYQHDYYDSPIDSGKYLVQICNAVPYQTSLGFNTKKIRDRLWLTTWVAGGRNNYIEFLKNNPPSIIINACTLGNHAQDDAFKNFMYAKNKNKIRFMESEKGSIGINFLNYTDKKFKVFNINDEIMRVNYLNTCIYQVGLEDEKSKQSCHKNIYTLHGFVQNAIEEYRRPLIMNPMCFEDIHPCSWHFHK